MSQGWAERDGNGHYWPAQPPMIPPSFYATPADPLVSPNYEGWWQRGTTLAGRVWKPALILHAIAAVPSLALMVPAEVLLNVESQKIQAILLNGTAALGDLGGYLSAILLFTGAALLVALISSLTAAVNVHLVIQAATGRPVNLRAATVAGLRRAPAIIGWILLGNLLTSLALLMCVLPVFYVGAAFMVLPVLVTLERGSGISRAFALFHADLGTSIARVATVFALTTVLAVGLGAVALVLELTIGGTAGLVTAALWRGLHYLAAGLIVTPLLVTAYADMRSRLEPFSTAYLMPQPTTPPAGHAP